MTRPDQENSGLGDILFRLSQDLVRRDPGSLARLRRMPPDGPGDGVFWDLATRHGLRTDEAGMRLVRMLALLTPKGAPDQHKVLHKGKRTLGVVLVGTGYPESRLLRLLAMPFAARGEALEGAVRWIAAKGHDGVNTLDLALLIFSADVKHSRRLAQDYYAEHYRQSAKKDDAA